MIYGTSAAFRQALEDRLNERSRAIAVFSVRATHPVPEQIPQPPIGWEPEFSRFAEDLSLAETTVAAAMRTVRLFWDSTREEL